MKDPVSRIQTQPGGNIPVCGFLSQQQHVTGMNPAPVDNLFGNAFDLQKRGIGFGPGHKRAHSLDPDNPSLFSQFFEGPVGGHARGFERPGQLSFRRHPVIGPQKAGINLFDHMLFDLFIQCPGLCWIFHSCFL